MADAGLRRGRRRRHARARVLPKTFALPFADSLFLILAGVTLGAVGFGELAVNMEERNSFGADFFQLGPSTLSNNQMAGIAVTSLDRGLAIGCKVLPIVAAEATRRVLVSDVVGMHPPVGLHFREEIDLVNGFCLGDQRVDSFFVGVFFAQVLFDLGFGILAGGVGDGRFALGTDLASQSVDDFGFRPRDRGVDAGEGHRLINGGIRSHELVGWPVVAVHAVHVADRMLGWVILELCGAVFGGLAIGVGHADPRDVEAVVVERDELDLIGDIHVGMNAFNRPADGIAATDLENHRYGEGGVGFIGEEVLVGLLEVAGVLLRPVAGLAGFLSWALIDVMKSDRAAEITADGMVKLADAADFGANVGTGTWTDVAGNAGDLSVGGVLVGLELGIHRGMAGLAAKRVGLCHVIGLITSQRGEKEKPDAATDETYQDATVPFAGQVDVENEVGIVISQAPADPAVFQDVTDENRDQAGDEKHRSHHIGENTHVGIGVGGEQIHPEEQQESEKRGERQDHPRKADPVAQAAEPGGK